MIAVYYTFHAKFHEIEEMYQPLLDLLVAARKSEGKVRVGTWTNIAFFRVEFLDNPKKELFEQLFHQSYAWRSDLFMDSSAPSDNWGVHFDFLNTFLTRGDINDVVELAANDAENRDYILKELTMPHEFNDLARNLCACIQAKHLGVSSIDNTRKHHTPEVMPDEWCQLAEELFLQIYQSAASAPKGAAVPPAPKLFLVKK